MSKRANLTKIEVYLTLVDVDLATITSKAFLAAAFDVTG